MNDKQIKTSVKVILGWALILVVMFGFYCIGKLVFFIEDYFNCGFSVRYLVKTFSYNPSYEPSIAWTVLDGFLGVAIFIFVSAMLFVLSYLGLRLVQCILGEDSE